MNNKALAFEYHQPANAPKTEFDEHIHLHEVGFCPVHHIQTHEVKLKGVLGFRRRVYKPITGEHVKNGKCLLCFPEDESRERNLFSDLLSLALWEALLKEDDDDDDGPWPGKIQKGSHVRCIGQSRGAGRVRIGDVGVVKSRDSDGDYRVDFPRRDNWAGTPSDLTIDEVAERVRPGALVKFKSGVRTPAYGLGDFRVKNIMHSVGFVMKVTHDGDVKLNFGLNFDESPAEKLFTAQLKELEPINYSEIRPFAWPTRLQIGQAVRVPAYTSSPSTGWGKLTPGEVGYVRAYHMSSQGTVLYDCDFPSVNGWKGRESDLEVETLADAIRPGARVRVREGTEPRGGWAEVTPRSVGVVRQIDFDGIPVVVDFPERKGWKALLNELEAIEYPRDLLLNPDVMNCPGQHGLSSLVAQNDKFCDWCGRSFGPGTHMYGCRRCNTDACEGCYDRHHEYPVHYEDEIPLAQATSVSFEAGDHVELFNLRTVEMNGVRGKVTKGNVTNEGRIEVCINEGGSAPRMVLVKVENVRSATTAEILD